MEYLITAYSDIGIKKRTNQDSMFIKVAETEYGKVCFSVLCDGMGGLAKGELASASIIRDFSKWFEYEFPEMLYKGINPENLRKTWENLIYESNYKIGYYSQHHNAQMGSTVSALLIVDGIYYIIHVGDSRIYLLDNTIKQLTKDQTFIQQEMDAGRMTPEEARRDPRRNMLLQCVGASNVIEPDFYLGEIQENSVFAICSDGFRHVITEEEIYAGLNPSISYNETIMYDNAVSLVELNKSRQEEDNISVALVRVT